MGGAQALSAIKTVASSGTTKWWEPEQSDMPGGEPRFAAEAKFETLARSLPKRSLPAFHWERLRRGEFGARIVLEGK